MKNYALVIDISSDEESDRYSSAIKTLHTNMVGRLNLSNSSVEVWAGSEADLSSTSASTFETLDSPKKVNFAQKENDEKGAFRVEQSPMDTDEDYNEETESPRQLPPLQLAPVLRNVHNVSPSRALCRQLKSTN